jgi:phosphoglucosamine mutase
VRKLFGTDGVRGVAGELLTAELALGLGRAVTAQGRGGRRRAPARARHPRHARVGEMLEAALAAA